MAKNDKGSNGSSGSDRTRQAWDAKVKADGGKGSKGAWGNATDTKRGSK